MSEAKPQDGSTVKGYRTLNPEEIKLMNRFKEISADFLDFLTIAKTVDADPRWLAMAKTDMQRACMAACRAVAKPDEDS